jgi:hypothetical protein
MIFDCAIWMEITCRYGCLGQLQKKTANTTGNWVPWVIMANTLKSANLSCLGQRSEIGQFCGIEVTWGFLAETLGAISFFGQFQRKWCPCRVWVTWRNTAWHGGHAQVTPSTASSSW